MNASEMISWAVDGFVVSNLYTWSFFSPCHVSVVSHDDDHHHLFHDDHHRGDYADYDHDDEDSIPLHLAHGRSLVNVFRVGRCW